MFYNFFILCYHIKENARGVYNEKIFDNNIIFLFNFRFSDERL